MGQARARTQHRLGVRFVSDHADKRRLTLPRRRGDDGLPSALDHSRPTGTTVRPNLQAGGSPVRLDLAGIGATQHVPNGRSLQEQIIGLRDRVEALGGNFAIESSSAGTSLSAELPVGSLQGNPIA